MVKFSDMGKELGLRGERFFTDGAFVLEFSGVS